TRGATKDAMRPAERRAPELLLAGVGGVKRPSSDERQHGHLRVGYGHGEAARRGGAGSTGAETRGFQVRCDGEPRSELGCRAHRYGLGDPHVRVCSDHPGRRIQTVPMPAHGYDPPKVPDAESSDEIIVA